MTRIVRKDGQLIERHYSLPRQDVPLRNGVAIARLVLEFDDVVLVVEHPYECLLEGEVHHPGVELRGGDFLEPLFVLVLQRYHLPAVGSTTAAFKGQVVVENSREVHGDFLSSCYFSDGLDSIQEDLRVGCTGVTDGFPALALPAPEIAPADLIVVVFDPVNDDDVLPCALLLIDQLFGLDVPGRVEHGHALLGVGPDDEVLPVSGLAQSGPLDHCLQKLFFGEVVAEKDVFQQAAGLERTDVVVERHGHWLEVYQEELGLVHSDSEEELSAEHEHSEEGFNALPDSFSQGFLLARLVPLLPHGVVLQLLSDVLRTILRETKLNRFECSDVAAGVVAETCEFSARDVLFQSGSPALIKHGLGHDFKGIGIMDQVILLSSDIIADLPIRLHHKRQSQLSILQFLQLKDIPRGRDQDSTAGSSCQNLIPADLVVLGIGASELEVPFLHESDQDLGGRVVGVGVVEENAVPFLDYLLFGGRLIQHDDVVSRQFGQKRSRNGLFGVDIGEGVAFGVCLWVGEGVWPGGQHRCEQLQFYCMMTSDRERINNKSPLTLHSSNHHSRKIKTNNPAGSQKYC